MTTSGRGEKGWRGDEVREDHKPRFLSDYSNSGSQPTDLERTASPSPDLPVAHGSFEPQALSPVAKVFLSTCSSPTSSRKLSFPGPSQAGIKKHRIKPLTSLIRWPSLQRPALPSCPHCVRLGL